MKRLAILFFILIFIVLLGTLIAQEPAYALFTIKSWVVQVPLWLLFFGLLLSFLLFHGILRMIVGLRYGLKSLHDKKKYQHLEKMFWLTTQGFIAFTEGHFKQARKFMEKSTEHNPTSFINDTIAARAAHALGDTKECNEFLAHALKMTPEAHIAIELVRAELQAPAEALLTLQALQKLEPKHPGILRALAALTH